MNDDISTLPWKVWKNASVIAAFETVLAAAEYVHKCVPSENVSIVFDLDRLA